MSAGWSSWQEYEGGMFAQSRVTSSGVEEYRYGYFVNGRFTPSAEIPRYTQSSQLFSSIQGNTGVNNVPQESAYQNHTINSEDGFQTSHETADSRAPLYQPQSVAAEPLLSPTSPLSNASSGWTQSSVNETSRRVQRLELHDRTLNLPPSNTHGTNIDSKD